MADYYFRFLSMYKKCDTTTTHSLGPRLEPNRVFSCSSKFKPKMDLDQGCCSAQVKISNPDMILKMYFCS